MRVIAILGNMGAGKDTVCNRAVSSNPKLFKKFAFADSLKELIHKEFGISKDILWGTQADKETVVNVWHKEGSFSPYEVCGWDRLTARQVLQYYGECKVSRNPSIWTDICFEKIKLHNGISLISDVRKHHELNVIKENGGKIIYLTRCNKSMSGMNHSTERSVFECAKYADFVIDNQNMCEEDQYLNLMEIISKTGF